MTPMNTDFELLFTFVRTMTDEDQEKLQPRRGSDFSAGWDLVADLSESLLIQPLERHLVPTGLATAIPVGWEGQIRPRSGLAFRHGLTVLNGPGTIDADYRGEIKVLLIHLGNEAFTLEPGTRMAQLVLTPTHTGGLHFMPSLPPTPEAARSRGTGGFGSTGRH
ncbi:MAG: dUTP diphosphatase [Deltaproteobacteria bacterium]|nr:dUTP diphosphatase [Deltaproteobacteria bacterium]